MFNPPPYMDMKEALEKAEAEAKAANLPETLAILKHFHLRLSYMEACVKNLQERKMFG